MFDGITFKIVDFTKWIQHEISEEFSPKNVVQK